MSSIPNDPMGPQAGQAPPPYTADGKPDWDKMKDVWPPRDSGLGFHKDHAEKREHDEREAKMFADLARLEEAKARQAELKAGAPAPNRDAAFASRTPRDILRRAAPPRYDFEDVPRAIGEFAWFFSQSTGYDPSGAVVAAVTAAASVIDDAFKLLVRPESDWQVSARQWAVLCGDPSAGKSPCIRAATAHVKYMHHELYERWREANEGLRREEKEPVPALYTSDSTIPALSVALQANPRGLLMLTEEFASWVGSIDSADRGESAKNRGDWLQLRDGGPHQINRVERGAVYVPNWGVSVLAACTPDGLAKQMKQMPEDGLIQRFIPCIMATPDLDVRADARDALREWGARLERAYTVTTTNFPTWLRLSEPARVLFEAEERSIKQLVIATEAFSPAYAAHIGKHPGMLAEVALTFHVFNGVQGGTPPPELSAEAMHYAIRYMRKARRHAHTLYSSILSSAPAFELARGLARSVVASEQPVATISRDWMTTHCQAFRKADDRLRREAVQMLEDADWLSAETHVRSYGGWPRSYAVHHKMFDLFAREGEQWRARRAAVRDMIGDAE
jgi:hypothetical protein